MNSPVSPPDTSALPAGNAALPTQSYQQMLDRLEQLEKLVQQQSAITPDTNSLNLLVFDGSRDRLLASFVMATGAAACGMQVDMFFTFWATAALRKGSAKFAGKTWVERAFGWMLPSSLQSTRLSQMDMAGLGRYLMSREMKKKNVSELPELIETAADLGVRISVCEMSMQLMGIRHDELIDYPGLQYCGVTMFVDQASRSNTTLFI